MIGQTISHYAILEKLGEGGMGVVYKAQDSKLDRAVALKFLPSHLKASDQDKARFTVEAKAAASLNHPNVCSIIDIQDHDGQMFIVMEFVDGHILRDKMRGMSMKQALDVAIQIADGLAAAHEKGIVHRDIKPENIMIRKDGIVQIMDFGLAKLRTSGSAITRLTREGSTVGTAGYMSPEQVQGQDADHRSDIFSYGVLVYELVSGVLPFRGAHETALMYEIVNVDPPPMTSVKPEIDPALDAIVLECLAKEPSERYQSIAEVAKDLRRYKRESTRSHHTRAYTAQQPIRTLTAPVPQLSEPAPPIKPRMGTSLPWIVAGLLFAAVLLLAYRQFFTAAPEKMPLVAAIVVPDSIYVHSYGQAAGVPALSPDGRNIAFIGVPPTGIPSIYIRSLNSESIRRLEGTEFPGYPFWSPDGKWIAFFASGKIKKVEIGGGTPVSICDALNPRGGTWMSSGQILFAPDFQSPIFQVSADGGSPAQVTRIDSSRGESSHRFPTALPDGKHFLYASRVSSTAGEAEGHAIFEASIDGKENRLLVRTTSNGIYSNGNLLYVRGSTLVAQRLNISVLALEGDPIALSEDVISDPAFNLSVISASSTGLLLFQHGHVHSGAKILLYDRAGKLSGTVGESIEHFRMRYSSDGRQLFCSIFDPKIFRLNAWRYDLRTGTKVRLTTGVGEDHPIPSPNGDRIVFTSEQSGAWNIYERPANGAGEGIAIAPGPDHDTPVDWSRDGSTVLFSRIPKGKSRGDIWMVRMNGQKRDLVPLVTNDFDQQEGRLSPDGNWLAYTSDESGQREIYVRAQHGSEAQAWKISSGGGGVPRWAGSSNEVCYINRQNVMTSAALHYAGDAVDVVSTKALFSVPLFLESYDISPDGKTFAVNQSLEIHSSAPLTIMANWDGEHR